MVKEAKMPPPRASRVKRITTLLIVSLLVVLLYLLYGIRHLAPCAPASESIADLTPIWYYCNSLDNTAGLGSEGAVPTSQYKLELVVGVIRHGDRYQLHSLPNHKKPSLSCNIRSFPYYKTYVPGLEGYPETLDANQKHIDNLFIPFGLYPQFDQCRDGYLTPIGATQHVRIGNHLRNVYLNKWKLIKNNYEGQVTMTTTTKQRTLQSGLALLYGFLPKFDLSKITLHPSQSNSFCDTTPGDFSCNCPSVNELQATMSQTYGQNRYSFKSSKEMKRSTVDVAEVFDVPLSEVPDASHVMDVSMVSMCHQLPLPGKDGKCIKAKSVQDVVQSLNSNSRKNTNAKLYTRICRTKMLPILAHITKTANAVMNDMDPQKFILYSGHDSTIDPLSVALGIDDGTWPMYASRIMFEFYSYVDPRESSVDRYVRILYNGKDLTNKVVFCKNTKFSSSPPYLCPFAKLQNFIESHGDIASFNLKSYNEACRSHLQL